MWTPLLQLLLLMRIAPMTATSCTSVSPSRSQFFEYQAFTVSCQQHSSANWTVWRHKKERSDVVSKALSPCGSDWGKPTSTGCLLPTVKPGDSGVYWCASRRGASCHGINITVTASVALVSPAVPVREGQDVPLHCEAVSSASNFQVTFFKNGSVIGNGIAINVTIRNFSASDQSPYWCKINGRESPHSWLLIEDSLEDTSISVEPNTAQIFEYEKINLSCGNDSHSLGWRVMRAARTGNSGDQLSLQPCGTQWGDETNYGCRIHTSKPKHTGLYWCESPTKARSNFLNISVYDTQVLLRIPATPVTVGGNVTLQCEEKGKRSQRATFYRNGFFYRTEPTGDMNIVHVSQSDEGVYKCEITDRGESPSSWLLVTGSKDADPSTDERPPTMLGMWRHLLVLFPYCISTVRLVFLCRRKGGPRPVSRADDYQLDPQYYNVDRDVITEHNF
ncbi:high affinity immunoglobulin gamma Fc receptor I-like isoform X2 [Nelusetta ayraudi]|uniref:high affinity immunoglobulin gamma Fc receptor I-like isoform X2 n=1 Tax=Nelusetta ayraudi TaxID=303726 RepID=UPI003F721D12